MGSGKSPGFGLTLTAETTTGVFLSAEICSNPAGGGMGPTVPEELGVRGAELLMEEIFRGGCADSLSQSLVVMVKGDEEDNSLRMGADKVVLTCVGVGFTNMSKR